jgi:hypothetical protein
MKIKYWIEAEKSNAKFNRIFTWKWQIAEVGISKWKVFVGKKIM